MRLVVSRLLLRCSIAAVCEILGLPHRVPPYLDTQGRKTSGKCVSICVPFTFHCHLKDLHVLLLRRLPQCLQVARITWAVVSSGTFSMTENKTAYIIDISDKVAYPGTPGFTRSFKQHYLHKPRS